MEELIKKAKELEIDIDKDITEDQLKELIESKEEDIKNTTELENIEKEKKPEDKIRVLDSNNKTISKNIEKEKNRGLGIKKQINTVHSKQLKQAENGEYYEEVADGIGMWSRTGESFLLKDLKK